MYDSTDVAGPDGFSVCRPRNVRSDKTIRVLEFLYCVDDTATHDICGMNVLKKKCNVIDDSQAFIDFNTKNKNGIILPRSEVTSI